MFAGTGSGMQVLGLIPFRSCVALGRLLDLRLWPELEDEREVRTGKELWFNAGKALRTRPLARTYSVHVNQSCGPHRYHLLNL